VGADGSDREGQLEVGVHRHADAEAAAMAVAVSDTVDKTRVLRQVFMGFLLSPQLIKSYRVFPLFYESGLPTWLALARERYARFRQLLTHA